jgi:tyrosyl-tRNA synthetase
LGADQVQSGLPIIDFLSEHTGFLASKGEARRALKENSISINKVKVNENTTITSEDLISSKHILVQRGKKNYFLVSCS